MIWLIDKTKITKNKVLCMDEERLRQISYELLDTNNPLTLKIIKSILENKHSEFFELSNLFINPIDLDIVKITKYFNSNIHTDFDSFLKIFPLLKFEVVDAYSINHLRKIESVFKIKGINNLEISRILEKRMSASKNTKIISIAQEILLHKKSFKL